MLKKNIFSLFKAVLLKKIRGSNSPVRVSGYNMLVSLAKNNSMHP